MAKLNRLIKGQDLAFDTHQAGDGQQTHWRDLHMEKRLHGGRGKLKFPLFGGALPSRPKRMSEDDYYSVIREVGKTLGKNSALLEDLAETIVNEVSRFSSGQATVGNALEAANKIAGYFGLGASFERKVSEELCGISLVTTFHFDKKDKLLYEIIQSRESVVVQASRVVLKKGQGKNGNLEK